MRKKIMILMVLMFSVLSLQSMAAQPIKEVEKTIVLAYQDLVGKEYKMISPFGGNKITLGFDVQNRIYGYTGLNRFWGQAEIENGKVKVGEVFTTENKGVQEQRILQVKYLTILKDVESIHFEGENLVLTTPFQEKLVFQPIL
ncbi:META domain protein [Fusobacterium gonidiaformans 3-1-5R]|uniref:META domain protein n=2 Tax=Fusobacterium TaxID=848 RepID=E5BDE8_9FUSO|nr:MULTISPECIES: META domain-containing protein [Fusobacterium]EFS21074.1 META domain protein [Fusobacterium gonidiaformans 3-1-5R]KXA16550.1 META domain protein [Fusobacterium equinum]